MKKLLLISLIISLLLSGCGKKEEENPPSKNNNDDIAGYKLVSTMDCEALQKEIVYMQKGVIITAENEVYAYNTEQKYSNGTNCAKFDEKVELFAIGDGSVYEKDKGVNFKVADLTLTRSDTAVSNKRLTPIHEAGYYIYMYGPQKNNQTTTYGVKKNSRTIYSFELGIDRRKENGFERIYYTIEKEQEDYSVSEGEIIVDFLYSRNEADYLKDYIRSDKSFYQRKITNKTECEEIVDVKCNYEWYKNDTLTSIVNRIAYYSTDELILKDGKIYNKS